MMRCNFIKNFRDIDLCHFANLFKIRFFSNYEKVKNKLLFFRNFISIKQALCFQRKLTSHNAINWTKTSYTKNERIFSFLSSVSGQFQTLMNRKTVFPPSKPPSEQGKWKSHSLGCDGKKLYRIKNTREVKFRIAKRFESNFKHSIEC